MYIYILKKKNSNKKNSLLETFCQHPSCILAKTPVCLQNAPSAAAHLRPAVMQRPNHPISSFFQCRASPGANSSVVPLNITSSSYPASQQQTDILCTPPHHSHIYTHSTQRWMGTISLYKKSSKPLREGRIRTWKLLCARSASQLATH